VLIAALLMTATIAGAQTRVKPGFNLFSAQQDVEIGATSATEVERQLPLVNDAAVEAYVDRIGQRLAAKAGGPGFTYRFRVINASDINAFALPGGYIYLNRGIIDGASNEGEVAGVIAHEIAHVSLRHGTHQASKAYATQAGLSLLGGLLSGEGTSESTTAIINALGGFGMNALFLKFSRDLEAQADIRGVQILAASGYSPGDMVSFFEALEKTDTSRKTSWLSSHPSPPDRMALIEHEAQLLNVSTQPTQRVAELDGIQARLQRLGAAPTMAQIASGQTPGTNAPTHVSTGVERPSTSLRSFTSGSRSYRISYPENWRVYKQGATGVVLAPDGGIAEKNGRTEIVYGAILNHYEPFGNVSSKGKSLSYLGDTSIENATTDLIEQVRKSDPHLKVVRRSTRKINLESGPALTAILRGANPRTKLEEQITVVTHQLADDHLIYLLFVTPKRDAKGYSSTLESMVRSIQIDDNYKH
jgi:Zn-dependent protease with chaperone function